MARDDPKTRYPLPPLRDQRLPASIPWDTEISELSDLWLLTQCECGRSAALPLRLLAAQLGWRKTLRTIVPKLKCKQCGSKPVEVVLTDNAAGPASSSLPDTRAKLVLVG